MDRAPGGEEAKAPETAATPPPVKPPITRLFNFIIGRKAPMAEPSAPAELVPEETAAPEPAPVEEPSPSEPMPSTSPSAAETKGPAGFEEREAGAWTPEALQAHLSEELRALAYEDSYECERNGCEGWKVLGATRRGRLHAHHGT